MEKVLRNINLKTEGIACIGCATDMETVLNNTDGILDATVSYASGTINIEYEPAEITPQQIILIIRKMGLKVISFEK